MAQQVTTQTNTSSEKKRPDQNSHIIAIGVGAGGLEALKEFFDHVPADCPHSFIITQHLSLNHGSLVAELLAKNSKLPIHKVQHSMAVEPASIYLIPPKKNITIAKGKLLLTDKPADLNLPIDLFFRSSAEDQGENTVAIVLNDTDSEPMHLAGIKQVHASNNMGGQKMVVEHRSAAVMSEALTEDLGMASEAGIDSFSAKRIAELEAELQDTRETLQIAIEEVETSNEELQVTNEELLAINGELQDTNEELQSVNAEYQLKMAEICSLNAEMDSLLKSTEIGTIFLDNDMNVRKFTPAIHEHFNLHPNDIGQPINNFSSHIGNSTILEDAKHVLQTKQTFQKEVQSDQGNWFLKRINPFHDGNGKVDGVVISFIDIDVLKRTEVKLKASESQFRSIFEYVSEGLAVIDAQGVIQSVNPSFAAMFGYSQTELSGLSIEVLLPKSNRKTHKIHRNGFMKNPQVRSMGSNLALFGLRKNNDTFPVEVSLSYFDNEDGATYVTALVIDTTERKQAEQMLRENEEKYRKLYHETPVMLHSIDNQGRLLSVSNRWLTDMGYTEAEVLGRMATEFLTPESRRYAIEEVFPLFNQTGEVHDILYTFVKRNGEQMDVLLSATAERDNQGRIVKSLAVIIDITARKLAVEALSESEQKFRVLYEEAPVMHLNVDANDAIIKDCNKLLVERLGYERKEDLIGQSIFTVYHEDCLADVDVAFNQFINTGKVKNAELALKNKDGSKIPVILNVSAIHNEQGEILYSSSTWVEITELKKTEEELRSAQNKLLELTNKIQMATQVAAVGIWDWDIPTNTLVWDDVMYSLYGIAKTTFANAYEPWRASLHPDDTKHIDQEIQLALKGEKEFDTEFRIIWPNQSTHHIKVLAKVERNADGEPIRMTGTNWDITEEREAIKREEMRLKQLEIKNKELEQFAYIASHDLQEPLRTIMSFGDQLKKDYQGKLDGNADQYLHFMAQAASRMSELIKGILDYSRVGHNGQQMAIDCNTLLNNIQEDLALSISETNTTIQTKSLPQVQGYETDLRMLFQNLITNAIKFRQKGIEPHITISAKSQKGYWEFAIQDNGIGIAAEHQDRVFKIFQRLHTRQDYEGTGIGLANCKKIVDLHGGEIWVESELNVGSTFHFTIRV